MKWKDLRLRRRRPRPIIEVEEFPKVPLTLLHSVVVLAVSSADQIVCETNPLAGVACPWSRLRVGPRSHKHLQTQAPWHTESEGRTCDRQ